MRQTTGTRKSPGEQIVKDIKRATRKHYSSEEKIRIVLDGLRGKPVTARLHAETTATADQTQRLAFDLGKASYFEPDTGLRLN